MNYIKLSNLLTKGDKDWFHIPRKEQEAYLNKLRTPKDTIDRGWLQYKCQQPFVGPFKRRIMEVASALYFPFFVIAHLLRKRRFVRKVDAVSEFKIIQEVIPDEMYKMYIFDHDAWYTTASLDFKDALYCIKLALRYPLSPLFVIKSSFCVAKYSAFISCYSPNAIIVHREYSFTSSVGTDYCRKKGVKHINIMHGDKVYWIRDSFFEYDECYIWSEHYKKLFIDLKAAPNQFSVMVPSSLVIDTKAYNNINSYADFKYYLDYYSDDEIHSIVESLIFVKEIGASVKFRPHPRYSNIQLLKKYVNDEDIEYPKDVNIMESISNLKWAVGSSTTALLQAYYSGKGVVCDDVTYTKQYEQLKEHEWILSNVDSKRLSNIRDLLS